MRTSALATSIAAACTALVLAAPSGAAPAPQLQGFPKNLARQHYGSTLRIFDAASNSYVATEAAAAWMDDDVATGWPPLAGKQNYLLGFSQPQLVTNVALSTKTTSGTVTIYAGDREAAPGDSSWMVVAKDVPIAAINNQKLARPLNKYAKYLLFETNVADPAAVYGLYIYGERSAASTAIVARTQPVDTKALLGDFVNNQTAFNSAGIYAGGLVSFSNGGGTESSWQRSIDDDPETLVSIKPSTSESGMVVRFDQSRPLSRLSLLSNPNARGKVDIFLLSEAPEIGVPVSLEGLAPSVTLTYDGTSPRVSADFAETNAAAMALRWTPDSGEAGLALREVNTFANLILANYEVSGAPVIVAQGPGGESGTQPGESSLADGKSIADGKSLADGKSIADGKSMADGKEPIALGPGPGRTPFLPGGLGFPPNVPVTRGVPPVPTPVSN
jgi:hypothetical protein